MNPITYSLCQKPVVGVAMWMFFLCGFPPLFSEKKLDLNTTGSTAKASFHAPVELKYGLEITFKFPSAESRIKDQIVGDNYIEECRHDIRYEEISETRRKGLGRPIPFRLIIRKRANKSIVLDRTFVSLCVISHGERDKVRTIGPVPLATGFYIAEIINLEKQEGLAGVETTISLSAGHGK